MTSENLFGLEYELRMCALEYGRATVRRGCADDDNDKVNARLEARKIAAGHLRDAARAYAKLADYIDGMPGPADVEAMP